MHPVLNRCKQVSRPTIRARWRKPRGRKRARRCWTPCQHQIGLLVLKFCLPPLPRTRSEQSSSSGLHVGFSVIRCDMASAAPFRDPRIPASSTACPPIPPILYVTPKASLNRLSVDDPPASASACRTMTNVQGTPVARALDSYGPPLDSSPNPLRAGGPGRRPAAAPQPRHQRQRMEALGHKQAVGWRQVPPPPGRAGAYLSVNGRMAGGKVR